LGFRADRPPANGPSGNLGNALIIYWECVPTATAIAGREGKTFKYVSDEDTLVTMQVGLVGTDGIVLASDLKTRFFDEYENFGLTSKILIDRARGLALAYAGYEISREVAKRILTDQGIFDLENSCHRQAIERIASEVYREPFPDLVPPDRRDSEILIVSSRTPFHFNSLEMRNENRCWLTKRYDKAVSGHRPNTATFFLERYYDRTASIGELKLLAAHVILTASRLNPRGIEGMEIVTCTESGLHMVPDKEIEGLTARSEKLDSEIKANLLPNSIR